MAEDLLDRPTVYGRRAKLGVIVPPTNTANEAEWWRMAPAGVSVHAARMPLHLDTESEPGRTSLRDDVGRHSDDLAQAGVDVIAYACTAGSMTVPVDALPAYMRARTGRPAITTAQAIVAALHALDVATLALATPYHGALNAHEIAFLAEYGLRVVAEEGLGYGAGGPDEFRNIARIEPAEVEALVRRVDRPEADAILVSCTDLATLDVIPRLEAALDKPVVSSNTATFWLALRSAGVEDRLDGFGRLLAAH